jgi:hypothetical protein
LLRTVQKLSFGKRLQQASVKARSRCRSSFARVSFCRTSNLLPGLPPRAVKRFPGLRDGYEAMLSASVVKETDDVTGAIDTCEFGSDSSWHVDGRKSALVE